MVSVPGIQCHEPHPGPEAAGSAAPVPTVAVSQTQRAEDCNVPGG